VVHRVGEPARVAPPGDVGADHPVAAARDLRGEEVEIARAAREAMNANERLRRRLAPFHVGHGARPRDLDASAAFGLAHRFSAPEYSRSAVVPIATRSLALRFDAQPARREAHLDRARRVGAKHRAAGVAVALEYVLARMAEAVAIADRE